jgi:predicted nucleic acid-binding protein
VDANVLLYAVGRASAHHEPALDWLDHAPCSAIAAPPATSRPTHLAALALEFGADIVSYDRDFARFPGITHRLPG